MCLGAWERSANLTARGKVLALGQDTLVVVDVVLPAVLGLVRVGEAGVDTCGRRSETWSVDVAPVSPLLVSSFFSSPRPSSAPVCSPLHPLLLQLRARNNGSGSSEWALQRSMGDLWHTSCRDCQQSPRYRYSVASGHVNFPGRGNFACEQEQGRHTSDELEGLCNALVVGHVGRFGVSRATFRDGGGSMAVVMGGEVGVMREL